MSNEPYLIVTPEQYQQGYLEKEGDFIRTRPYVPLKKLDDGNWLVQAPAKKTSSQLEAERQGKGEPR